MKQYFYFLLSLFIAVQTNSCSTPKKSYTFGVQTEAYYIPARTALFPCQPWPSRVGWKDKIDSNSDKETIKELCEKFDKYIIESFKDQPWMRGMTPRLVKKLMLRAGLDNDFTKSWPQPQNQSFADAISYYQELLYHESQWKIWLSKVSQNVRFADAVLLPFVNYARENEFNDRGLLVAEKKASIALFLVNTETGKLIWSGGRNASFSNEQLDDTPNKEKLVPPSWEVVYIRLFQNDIWKDYPGRKTFN
ncbi:MAG: hypothetical protein CMP10_13470 [Zetaproteobacteria bacterium]|nr:hypothetical protein [Pseudobdellovibrionaceae bacterium]